MTTPANRTLTYADAGVDIAGADLAKKTIGSHVKSTYTSSVVGGFGHFGGLFDISAFKHLQKPILVSSVDGVGTKLKIAFDTGIHDTVGEDIVNHCINDILVMGAMPLFFLDYIASGKLEAAVVTRVVEGMARACRVAGTVLIGGETAEMPDFYKRGEYDIAGTIVGVVDEQDIVDGSAIREGDSIIGLRSSGLHTNGYSLARKIVTDVAGKKYSDRFGAYGTTFGEVLLAPHRSYLPIRPLIIGKLVRGCAHITGGGFPGNVNRILPHRCDAVIDAASWRPDPIFRFLQDTGNVENLEMYTTFNMGVGMALVVEPSKVEKVINAPETAAFSPVVIGRIVKGNGGVTMKF